GSERGFLAGEALRRLLVPPRPAAPSLPFQPPVPRLRPGARGSPDRADEHPLLGAEPVRHPQERAQRAGVSPRRILRGAEGESPPHVLSAPPARGPPDRAPDAVRRPPHRARGRVRRRGHARVRGAPDGDAPRVTRRANATAAGAPPRALGLLASAIVFAAGCAVFLPTLRYPFLNWDDNVYVVQNPWIRSLSWENVK